MSALLTALSVDECIKNADYRELRYRIQVDNTFSIPVVPADTRKLEKDR